MIEKGDAVYLKSITMHSPQHCGFIKLVEINKFSNTSLTWTTNAFFSDDIFNFHKCKLEFGVVAWKLQGLETRIIETIAPYLNFSVLYNTRVLFNDDVAKYTFEDASQRVDMLVNKETIDKFSFYDDLMSDTIEYTFLRLTIPYSETYTQLEKMLLPFDAPTWMLLGIVFLAAYCVILLIKTCYPPEVADLVYGERNASPGLNVFNIFMGGGLKITPRKNFPRILLMTFLLFCLIMR